MSAPRTLSARPLRRVLTRGALVLGLLLAVAVPSWTLNLLDLGLTIEEARDRYLELSDGERLVIHQRYADFNALSTEEREDLRRRGRNLARISRRQEELPLPADVSDELSKLSPREQREFQQTLLEEELREKGREILRAMPERSRKELEDADGARERAAFMRQYKRQNVNRILNTMIHRLGERLEVPSAEVQRILQLPKSERLRAFLELNVGLTEEEVLRTGLPFGITPEQWEEWRRLPGEEFFAAVVEHRERLQRLRHERRLREEPERAFEEPAPERLAALVRLLEAVRKQPRDFVELADLEPGRRRRLELGKRKRTLCERAILEGELVSTAAAAEIPYMTDPSFFGLVRTILQEAGGPERIEGWAGLEAR